MVPPSETEAAPAKVNLTLHVTGQRADGYHLLDSLVVFVDVADRVTVTRSETMALSVEGPLSGGVPADGRNLVWRATEAMAAGPLAITLEKHLPAAAGIGGGSSDAAALLRAAARLTGAVVPGQGTLLALGADVPVCLDPRPVRMRGVGEDVSPVARVPPLWLVLANPGVAMATPAVFRELTQKVNPPMDTKLPGWPSAVAFCDWLGSQRNDLQAPACALSPEIAPVLAALANQPGCQVARMSGSGATCFGVFTQAELAERARAALSAAHPGWWTACGAVLG